MLIGKSTVTFNYNKASNGGVLYVAYNSTVVFGEISEVTFNSNQGFKGGAIYIAHQSSIKFDGNSIVKYYDNTAFSGAALYAYNMSDITFQGNATVTFNNNTATQNGGVLYSHKECEVSFKDNSRIVFTHNKALQGSVIYSMSDSYIKFKGNCTVEFIENAALEYGGAIHSHTDGDITMDDYATITFNSNKANRGGAIYSYGALIMLTGKSNNVILFKNNSAEKGGALMTEISSIILSGNSCISFSNNTAFQDGGAFYLNDHSHFVSNVEISFYHNVATDYGGAIYVQMNNVSIDANISGIHFKDNDSGSTNSPMYIDMPKSCNKSCLFKNIRGISEQNSSYNLPVATSPYMLIVYDPVKCIHYSDMKCDTYYISNVMLGQEITFDACVLDYYDRPVGLAELSVASYHPINRISGSKFISISCNHTTQGIRIMGKSYLSTSYNFSMIISLHKFRSYDSKILSVNLTVELSQCHPGFWYFNKTEKCECYNTKNIVSCSGSNSTIKSGYWFGYMNGIPTVASCPHGYYNFTCCMIMYGIYHLSPVRSNQCRQHRTGVACGNCEKGYTLSFGSSQCIAENMCTLGQTILVVTLTILYWMGMMVVVFIVMYFNIAIGSLLAINHYYSTAAILLSQDYFTSNGLDITYTVMSGFTKLFPSFLEQKCLVRNMSGIDQKFIHYIYPIVVSFIVFMTVTLAKRSQRISSFISRGVVHFVCFLLLMSYTSLTTTSLLLFRPLTFTDIDSVYTYLSPDIQYFHGRHLAYAIVAITFTIVVVIGLPLLLLLEPFLNSKINFVKIKPLLDHFQGCYKDKYRYFAAYYMICRIVIIVLIIAKIFDSVTTQYLVISVCALMEFIHLMVRPYVNTVYNMFDGVILQLIVIVSVLPIVEFVNSYNETLVMVTACLLVIAPFAGFITINLWIEREKVQNAIKKIKNVVKTISNVIKHCSMKCSSDHVYSALPSNDADEPTSDFGITVDDNTRRNATVVTM